MRPLGDNPFDYAAARKAKGLSAKWTGVLTFGAIAMSAPGLLMGLGARRGGLYSYELRNAVALIVLSAVSVVGVAIRLPKYFRTPRNRVGATMCVVGIAAASGMIAVATWGLLTGVYL